jgi:hypothetical protein
MLAPKQKFQLGQVMATPQAMERMEEHGIRPMDLLVRHATGDWGDLSAADKRENVNALRTGARIFSAYGQGDSKLYVITDAEYDDGERKVTTILRPEDY